MEKLTLIRRKCTKHSSTHPKFLICNLPPLSQSFLTNQKSCHLNLMIFLRGCETKKKSKTSPAWNKSTLFFLPLKLPSYTNLFFLLKSNFCQKLFFFFFLHLQMKYSQRERSVSVVSKSGVLMFEQQNTLANVWDRKLIIKDDAELGDR